MAKKSQKKQMPLNFRLLHFIKNLDFFGEPIQITYRNDTKIRSVIGGIVSIAFIILAIAYFADLCSDVSSQKATVQHLQFYQDLTNDKTYSTFTQDQFDIAFKIEYTGSNPMVSSNMDNYFYLYAQNYYQDSTGQESSDSQYLEYGLCSQDRFSFVDNTVRAELSSAYYCIRNMNFKLRGNQESDYSSSLRIQVKSCNQTYLNSFSDSKRTCNTTEEIASVSQFVKLHVYVKNSYFGAETFSDDPVSSVLKPYQFSSRQNSTHNVIMKLSSNSAEMRDYKLYGKTQTSNYYQTKYEYSNIQQIQGVNSNFIDLKVYKDEAYVINRRKTATMLTVFEGTASFILFWYVIAQFLLRFITLPHFYVTLMKSLYYIQQNKENKLALTPSNTKPYDHSNTIKKKSTDIDDDEVNDSSIIDDTENHKGKHKVFVDFAIKEEAPKSAFLLILNQFIKRKKLTEFTFSFIDKCKKRFQKNNKLVSQRAKIYKQGVKKFKAELDIRVIQSKLRAISFMSNILLQKNQSIMLPYNKESLLSTSVKQPLDQDLLVGADLQNTLKEIIIGFKQDEIEQRIVDAVYDSQEDKKKKIKNTDTFKQRLNESKKNKKKQQTRELASLPFKKNDANIEDILSSKGRKGDKEVNIDFIEGGNHETENLEEVKQENRFLAIEKQTRQRKGTDLSDRSHHGSGDKQNKHGPSYGGSGSLQSLKHLN